MQNGLKPNSALTNSLPDAKRISFLDLILCLKITYKILRKLVPLRTISDAYAFLWANYAKMSLSNFLSSTRWLSQIFFRKMSNSHFLFQSPLFKFQGEEKVVKEIGRGTCFGEVALIKKEPRSATVTATSDVTAGGQ